MTQVKRAKPVFSNGIGQIVKIFKSDSPSIGTQSINKIPPAIEGQLQQQVAIQYNSIQSNTIQSNPMEGENEFNLLGKPFLSSFCIPFLLREEDTKQKLPFNIIHLIKETMLSASDLNILTLLI